MALDIFLELRTVVECAPKLLCLTMVLYIIKTLLCFRLGTVSDEIKCGACTMILHFVQTSICSYLLLTLPLERNMPKSPDKYAQNKTNELYNIQGVYLLFYIRILEKLFISYNRQLLQIDLIIKIYLIVLK